MLIPAYIILNKSAKESFLLIVGNFYKPIILLVFIEALDATT